MTSPDDRVVAETLTIDRADGTVRAGRSRNRFTRSMAAATRNGIQAPIPMRIQSIEYELASTIETLEELGTLNPDWQVGRLLAKTGIAQHYVSKPGETPLSMANRACERLLNGHDRSDIDGLIYVTQSPESRIPATACLLHQQLGLPQGGLAFDLNQGCSGFVYGLSVAAGLMHSGQMRRCLLVCAEAYTKYITHHDRTCRPIFSDGAGVALLDGTGGGEIGPFIFVTDGSGAPNLTLRQKNGAAVEGDGELYMNGPKVLQFTMQAVPQAVRELLRRAGKSVDDIDLFIFHQASKVVLDRVQDNLALDGNRLFRNYETMGNTVSATIPVALSQARQAGRLADGMTVMLMGFGVGYSLAGCVLTT